MQQVSSKSNAKKNLKLDENGCGRTLHLRCSATKKGVSDCIAYNAMGLADFLASKWGLVMRILSHPRPHPHNLTQNLNPALAALLCQFLFSYLTPHHNFNYIPLQVNTEICEQVFSWMSRLQGSPTI